MTPSRHTPASLAVRVHEVADALGHRALHVWQVGWKWIRVSSFEPSWLPAPWRHPGVGYLTAGTLMVIAVIMTWFMLEAFPRYMFAGSLQFLVVVVVAFLFGAGPSLFATLLGTTLLWYIVLMPFWRPTLGGVEDLTGLAVHSVVGVIVAIFAGRIERARQQEAKERRLASQLSARLQTTLDVLPVGVGIAEADGTLAHTNHSFQELWDDPRSSMQSESAHADGRERQYPGWNADGAAINVCEWAFGRALRHDASVLNEEVEISTVVGARRSVLCSAAPIHNAQGMVDGGVIVLLDITERRALERRTHVTLTTMLAMAAALTTPPPEVVAPLPAPTSPAAPDPSVPQQAAIEPWERARERAAMHQVLTLTQHLFNAQSVSVVLVAEDTDALEPIAIVGLDSAEAQRWWAAMSDAHFSDIAPELDNTWLPAAQDPSVVHVGAQALSIAGLERFKRHNALLVALRLQAGRICLIIMEMAAMTLQQRALTPQDFEVATATARLVGSLVEQERLLREREEARASALALEESNRRMDTFLGIASHELRTPLTSSTLSVHQAGHMLDQWLAAASASPTSEIATRQLTVLRALIDLIEGQMARQGRLVADLLDVSRLQVSELHLHIAPCDLVAVVRQAVDEQRLLHPERVITLDIASGGQPVIVMGDVDRIGQAVTNYLSNALKYSLEREPVRVTLDATEQRARVRVQDAGVGIPPEAQERLWDRFYRVSDVAVRSGSGIGLGLGLYITRSIIERLGGEVGVTSVPGFGATFWFTLPCSPQDSQP